MNTIIHNGKTLALKGQPEYDHRCNWEMGDYAINGSYCGQMATDEEGNDYLVVYRQYTTDLDKRDVDDSCDWDDYLVIGNR